MDPDTGEVLSGYLFVAVLPFSGYAFAFSCSDMKPDNWIQAHISLFEFLGGVPLLVVSDNLRTGVKKHTRSTLVLNRNYEDLANHYHTVILPARVKKPKDKVSVENTAKRLTTHVVARMRNYTFFSLEEYNQRSMKEVHRFNTKPFQKRLALVRFYSKTSKNRRSNHYRPIPMNTVSIKPSKSIIIVILVMKSIITLSLMHLLEEKWR